MEEMLSDLLIYHTGIPGLEKAGSNPRKKGQMKMTQWIRTALLGMILGTVLILSPQRALAEEAGSEAEKGSFWEEILQDVNWEGIRDGVQEGLQTIGAEAAEKAERLSTQGQALAEEIKTQAKGYMEELAPYVEQAKTAAQQVIGEAGVKLEQAKTVAQQVVSEAGVKLEEAKTAAQQVVSEAGVKLEEMKEAVREAWPGYRDAAVEWVNAEKAKLAGYAQVAEARISEWIGQAGTWFADFKENAGMQLQTLCEWLQEKLEGLRETPATPAN